MKEIPGHEGYFINTFGEVFKGDNRLPEWLHSNGYLKVNLEFKKPYSIHRLVALTFIPNPDNKRCVCHKNNIKTDNKVENLYWGTQKENIYQAMRDGIMKVSGKDNPMYGKVGELNPYAKVTDKQRNEIVDRFNKGEKVSEISIDYPITENQVRHIIKQYIK